MEIGAFLGVLQDCGIFEGSVPADVVEALGVYHLLQVSLLEPTIIEDNSVICWGDAVLALLAHYEEVIASF